MKAIIKLLVVGFAMMPVCSSAQTHVKKAFERLTGNSSASIIQNHSLEKDSETGAKVSQYDVYRFALPANKISLVRDIERAFTQDAGEAYSITSGIRGIQDPPIAMAIGEGNGTGLMIAATPGMNFIYACYLDPQDPEKNHRYAYAMDWIAVDDSIKGTLGVTYSTTLKYRQQKAYDDFYHGEVQNPVGTIPRENKNALSFNDMANFFGVFMPQAQYPVQTWFSVFMDYISSMNTNDIPTNRVIAAKIYELAKNIGEYEVTPGDKETAREVLGTVTDEINDEVVINLLKRSLIYLK